MCVCTYVLTAMHMREYRGRGLFHSYYMYQYKATKCWDTSYEELLGLLELPTLVER